jgi:hypothetical protein
MGFVGGLLSSSKIHRSNLVVSSGIPYFADNFVGTPLFGCAKSAADGTAD